MLLHLPRKDKRRWVGCYKSGHLFSQISVFSNALRWITSWKIKLSDRRMDFELTYRRHGGSDAYESSAGPHHQQQHPHHVRPHPYRQRRTPPPPRPYQHNPSRWHVRCRCCCGWSVFDNLVGFVLSLLVGSSRCSPCRDVIGFLARFLRLLMFKKKDTAFVSCSFACTAGLRLNVLLSI